MKIGPVTQVSEHLPYEQTFCANYYINHCHSSHLIVLTPLPHFYTPGRRGLTQLVIQLKIKEEIY